MSIRALPEPVQQHIIAQHVEQLEPAWVQIQPGTDTILQVGGAWQHYFEQQPAAGHALTDYCDFLFGILPMQEPFELPQMQWGKQKYADISGIHQDGKDWILFCDVSQQTLQMQQYQQVSNDLVLLKSQLNRTLRRYVGHEVLDRIQKGSLQFDVAGDRRIISTLFVDIRGFTPFNERHDAQVVMQTLNDYMDCMLPPILSKSGIIDKITGDGAMAIFGIATESREKDCTKLAFSAAQIILACVSMLNQQRSKENLEQLGVGIGIATGEAVLGVLGSHERRCFTAIGPHVNLAARLESHARVGEILMDEESVLQLHDEDFTPIYLTLKGIGEIKAYSDMRTTIIHE